VCKKCKKAFRKDAREFEDRYAHPHPYPHPHPPPRPRRSNAC
jgi:hypothetical protein